MEETVDIGNGMSFLDKVVMFKHMILFAIPWKSPYMRAHPAPLVPDYATRHIQMEIPMEFSKKILKNVKTRGVSLHSVWTAAAGIAMHRMLNLNDKTKLRSTHEVDLRVLTRNYDSLKCKIFVFITRKIDSPTNRIDLLFLGRIHGMYCNYAEVTIETNRTKSVEEFWDYATIVHEKIGENINANKLVKMMKYCTQFGDMYSMFATLGSVRSVRNDYAIAVHDNVDLFMDDRDAIEVKCEKLL